MRAGISPACANETKSVFVTRLDRDDFVGFADRSEFGDEQKS